MSETDTALQAAEALLAPWAKATANPGPHRLDVTLDVTDVAPAVTALCEAGWGYLTAITGLDLGVAVGAIEVLYHFCTGPAVLTLRVRTPRDAAHVPSICDILPSANLFERELSEMFGVTVDGLPNPERLFLPDDWPGGVYPLRKDFEPQEVLA